VAQQVLHLPDAERHGHVTAILAQLMATALRMEPAALDTSVPISHLGVDSLIALELKRALDRMFGFRLSVVDLLRGPSIAALASSLLQEIIAPSGRGHEGNPQVADDDGVNYEQARQLLAQLDQLADAEVDAALEMMRGRRCIQTFPSRESRR
jgi:acyl carrier protein